MSNNEILYDRDGNVVGEDDIAKGLKEIMEYHMNKLKKSLVIMGVLAKTEDKEWGRDIIIEKDVAYKQGELSLYGTKC